MRKRVVAEESTLRVNKLIMRKDMEMRISGIGVKKIGDFDREGEKGK